MLSCEQLKQKLQEIKQLRFRLEGILTSPLDNLEKTPKRMLLDEAERLKDQIEAQIPDLFDAIFPEIKFMESEINLKEQYESQRKILTETEIVQKLRNGEDGIVGVDGSEYAVPTYEEILKHLIDSPERLEILETKIKQGFTKLLLVPFAMPFGQLCQRYGQELRKSYQEGKLKNKEGIQISFNKSNPVRFGLLELAYYDESLHVYDKSNLVAKNAWQVALVEDWSDIRERPTEELNGRLPLDINKSGIVYMQTICHDRNYKNEQGFTPELWLAHAISNLKEKSEVVELQNDNPCLLTGTSFKHSNEIPVVCWQGDSVLFSRVDAFNSNRTYTRTAVNLF